MNNKTLLLVLVGFALRLFLIFPGPFESKVEFFTNKADLRNYYWPAQAALRGENPYALWASGQSGEFRADMAPLELLMYVVTVAAWNDPRAIQVLFAVFDAINIALLGVLLKYPSLKLSFQVFYAFGPLTLYNLTLVPQDKTILLTLTFLVFYWLLQSPDYVLRFTFLRFTRAALVIVTAALLASFKWLSVFYLLPLLLFVSRDVRAFVKHGLIFAVVVGLAHLAWFPSWTYVYIFRSTQRAPFHISPAALLNAFGRYDARVLMALLAVSLVIIYALFWLKRVDIFETMALSVAAGVLWTPDMDPVHLSIVVIHLLLVLDWTRGLRRLWVWVLSAWVAALYAITAHTSFGSFNLAGLQSIVGAYGSPRMIVLSFVLFIVVLAFYLSDKSRGRAVGEAILVAGSD